VAKMGKGGRPTWAEIMCFLILERNQTCSRPGVATAKDGGKTGPEPRKGRKSRTTKSVVKLKKSKKEGYSRRRWPIGNGAPWGGVSNWILSLKRNRGTLLLTPKGPSKETGSLRKRSRKCARDELTHCKKKKMGANKEEKKKRDGGMLPGVSIEGRFPCSSEGGNIGGGGLGSSTKKFDGGKYTIPHGIK